MWKSSKMLPKTKSLSSVDHVTAFCSEAVMHTINFTVVPLFTCHCHRHLNVFQAFRLTGP